MMCESSKIIEKKKLRINDQIVASTEKYLFKIKDNF